MNRNSKILAVLIISILAVTGIVVVAFGDVVNVNDLNQNGGDKIEISGDLATYEKTTYEKVRPSIVTIYISGETENGDNETVERIMSQGSGFVYSQDYIITNYHVIQNTINNGHEIHARFYDDRWKELEIQGYDQYTDLAVLQMSENEEYPSLKIKEELPEVGSRVIAAGSPRGYENSITTGIISGTERTMRSMNPSYSIPDTIQTDAALTNGNSGGPLVNLEGKVVGVNRAAEDNIGLAVSNRLTISIANSLIKNGDHQHPFIGISTIEFNPAQPSGYDLDITEGVMVAELVEEGPAKDSDLRPSNPEENEPGDVILEIDGNRVKDNEDLSSYLLRTKKPGDTITMTILRQGEEKEITLELGDRP